MDHLYFKAPPILYHMEQNLSATFFKEVFPDMTGIIIGGVIQDCWTKKIVSAAQALACFQHVRIQAASDGKLSSEHLSIV